VWQSWGTGGYNFANQPFYDTNTYTSPSMFRFYSMGLGRWLSPDPMGGDVTNPQSLNRYAYALNSPTSLTDPLGLQPCPNGTHVTNPGQCAGDTGSWPEFYGGDIEGTYNGFNAPNCSLDQVDISCAIAENELQSGRAALCPYGECGLVTMTNGLGQEAIGEFQPTQTDPSHYQQLTSWTYGGLSPAQYFAAYMRQLNAVVQALMQAGADINAVLAFIRENNNPQDLSTLMLHGGNFDWYGSITQFGLDCQHLRCDEGDLGTIDFSHNGGMSPTFHLDTADPYGLGIFQHSLVDVLGGNFVWMVIPR
jgi:RHS repeat-associated protein